MKMPGFSAEASINKNTRFFRGAGHRQGPNGSKVVLQSWNYVAHAVCWHSFRMDDGPFGCVYDDYYCGGILERSSKIWCPSFLP